MTHVGKPRNSCYCCLLSPCVSLCQPLCSSCSLLHAANFRCDAGEDTGIPTKLTTPGSFKAALVSTLPSLARALADSTGAANSSRVLTPTSATYTASPLACTHRRALSATCTAFPLACTNGLFQPHTLPLISACLHKQKDSISHVYSLLTRLHRQMACTRHIYCLPTGLHTHMDLFRNPVRSKRMTAMGMYMYLYIHIYLGC